MSIKLKTLVEDKADKVSDTIKELYPYKSQMRVVRVQIYGDHRITPAYKESLYTVRLDSIGGKNKGIGTGYIVELKRAVQVTWRGKTPTHLSSNKAKWEITEVRLYK